MVIPQVIAGITFEERFHAFNCFFDRSLIFTNCVFKKGVDFRDAFIQGSLTFESCHFEPYAETNDDESDYGINLKRIRVGGRLNLRGVNAPECDVQLNSAQIEAGIRCGALEEVNWGNTAQSRSYFKSIQASDAVINGSVDIGGTELGGTFRMVRSTIQGSLLMTWHYRKLVQGVDLEELQREKWKELVTKIGGDLDLDRINITGDVSGRGAQIAQNVVLTNATIGGSVTFRAWHPLERTDPRSEYDCPREIMQVMSHSDALVSEIGSLVATGISAGSVNLTGCIVNEEVDLTGGVITALRFSRWKPRYAGESKVQDSKATSKPAAEEGSGVGRVNIFSVDGSVLKQGRHHARGEFRGWIGKELRLRNLTVKGPISIMGSTIVGGIVANGIRVEGDFEISNWSFTAADGNTAAFASWLGESRDGDRRFSLDLRNSNFHSNVVLDGTFFESGIDMFSTQIRGSLTIDPGIGKSGPGNTHYVQSYIGEASDSLGRTFSLRLTSSNVNGNVVIRSVFAKSGISLESSSITGDFDLGPFRYNANRYGFSKIGCGRWSIQGEQGIRVSPDLALHTASQETDIRSISREYSVILVGLIVRGSSSMESITTARNVQADRAELNGGFSLASRSVIPFGTSTDLIPIGQQTVIDYGMTSIGRPFSVMLPQAIIGSNLNLTGVNLKAGIYLSHATIKGSVWAGRNRSGGDQKSDGFDRTVFSIYQGSELSPDRWAAFRGFHLTVDGQFLCEEADFIGGIHLENSTFGQGISFRGVNTGNQVLNWKDPANKPATPGSKPVSTLLGMRQNGGQYAFWLTGIKSRSDVIFKNCYFPGPISLRDASIEGSLEFTNTHSQSVLDIDGELGRCEELIFGGEIPSEKESPLLIAALAVARSCQVILPVGGALLALALGLHGLLVLGGSIIAFLLCYIPFVISVHYSRPTGTSAFKVVPRGISFNQLIIAEFRYKRKAFYVAKTWTCVIFTLFLGTLSLTATLFAKESLPELYLLPVGLFFILSMLTFMSWLARELKLHRATATAGPARANTTEKEFADVRLREFLTLVPHSMHFFRQCERNFQRIGDEAGARRTVLTMTENQVMHDDRPFTMRLYISWLLHVTVGHGLRPVPLLGVIGCIFMISAALFSRPESVMRPDEPKVISDSESLFRSALADKYPGQFGKQYLETDRQLWIEMTSHPGPVVTQKEMDKRFDQLLDGAVSRSLDDYLTPDTKEQAKQKFIDNGTFDKVDWRKRSGFYMAFRYLVPFAQVMFGSDWVASRRSIDLPKNQPVLNFLAVKSSPSPAGAELAGSKALTYQDLASFLSIIGWILIPLLIGSITSSLRKMKTQLSED